MFILAITLLLAGCVPTSDRNAARPNSSVSPRETNVVVVENAHIIDGTGKPPIKKGFIVIKGPTIAKVARGRAPKVKGAEVIDAKGAAVLPGLIDAHVHVEGLLMFGAGRHSSLRTFLTAGITTLRDVGSISFPGAVADKRSRVEALGEEAPRVVWAGPILTAPGGYPKTVPQYSLGGQEISSEEEGRTWVRTLSGEGAKIVKLGLEQGYYRNEGWPLMSLDVVKAISAEAHQHKMKVTAHATSIDEVQLAIDGGVDDLAHTPVEPLPPEMIQQMVRQGMAIVTTVGIFRQLGLPNVVAYSKAGGRLAVGTDFGCCQQTVGSESYLKEITLMSSGGLTPMQIIVASTRHAAEVSNIGETVGTLQSGKLADLIIVKGDPLKELNDLLSVERVIKAGRPLEMGRARAN